MPCKLCGKDVPLLNSHVIPESLYELIYDGKHRILPILTDTSRPIKMRQQGFKEELLCEECEKRFSKWERSFKLDLIDITKRESNYLNFQNIEGISLHVSNIKYTHFKNALLSILWRMSISKDYHFKNYNLGPYEEKLKSYLSRDEAISECTFPIIMSRATLNGKHLPDIIMLYPARKIERQITIQTFILWGFQFQVVIQDYDKLCKCKSFYLKEDGSILIPDFNHKESVSKSSVHKRLFDDDVKSKMDKLLPRS